MQLVLDIATSVEFWRRIYPADRTPKLEGFGMPGQCACTMKEIGKLVPKWANDGFLDSFDGRIHVLSLDSSTRRSSKRHTVHVWGDPMPDGSFYKLENDLLVETPAFMFLVASSLLTPAQLVAFGCEICGLYSFDSTSERGFRSREAPLCTVSRLSQYLAGAKGCRGYSKAIAALPHIVENSASPMETFDTQCLCLPYRLGGYSLDKPQMNCEVVLSAKAARIARRKKCFLDMGYLEARLDIEHHGKHDHSSPEDQASDRARVNALKEMGFEVIELTSDQVNDLVAFDYIVQRIAKILGKRIRKEHRGVTGSRIRLHRELRDWNESSGRLR